MNLQIVYFKVKGFWDILFPFTFSGLFFDSSDNFYFWFWRFRMYKAHLFYKYFELVDLQEVEVDYDIYVRVIQHCMRVSMIKNFHFRVDFGAGEIYTILFSNLKLLSDYSNLKELNAKQISEINHRELKNYINNQIIKLNV